MDRRTYLSVGATVALAGCTELRSSDEPDGTDDSDEPDWTDDHDADGSDSTGETSDTADDPDDGDEDESDDSDEDEYPDLVGTFDDFEDLDEWWEWQDIGSLEADTGRSYDGSQSALLTSSPDSRGQVRVRRELDEPIDVREVAPGLALATDTDEGVVRIQLQDEDAHYVEYSQQIQGDTSLTPYNFGITRVRGDPDLSEVVVLQVIRWFGDDAEGRQWVDDFHFVPRPTTGKVLLQFHGGYETHYTEALSLLEEYDVPATAFVPTARIRDDDAVDGDRLTHAQVEELAEAGWTISAQPADGQPLVGEDADELRNSVVEPIDWLTENGYDDGARFFAYPGGRYTEESYELVREQYDLAFAGLAESQGYAKNPHLCSVVGPPEPGEASKLLDWTVEWGGITNVAFSGLGNDDALEALDETLAALDDRTATGDLDVIGPAEMAAEYVY